MKHLRTFLAVAVAAPLLSCHLDSAAPSIAHQFQLASPEPESQPARAGTLLGVGFVDGANTLVIVNPVTGALTPVRSFPDLFGIPQGVSALDVATHRYFFPLADRLFVVDTRTGAVLADPPFPEAFSSLDFESTTGKLFGVGFIDGANTLAIVNPETGALTPVRSFPDLFGVPQGVAALDATTHRYFFPLAERLFVVDTRTGAVLADPPFPEAFSSLDFESSTGTLFGVVFVDAANTVVIVNPETGALTPVRSLPDLFGVPQGVAALDGATHRYFFPLAERLFVVDTRTGAVLANPPFVEALASLEFEAVTVHEVGIDIKPATFVNSVNPEGRGVIPVAVLTTDMFDAATADPHTIAFGPSGAAPVHHALEDADGDGDMDLILHFRTRATGIHCGDTAASLTGATFAGELIHGSDAVRTVGCS
ncbi:MAG TPA: hypothetical protein VGA18_07510 [Rhodothermales bacterium]